VRAVPDALLEISARQIGLIGLEQSTAAGMSRSARRHAVASGRLEQLTGRVLRVPGVPVSDRQRVMAAVLDTWQLAFACGPTCAALWDVPGYRLLPANVARPEGVTRRRSQLATVHEIAGLSPRHVTRLYDIPCVRPEVLVLQLCGLVHPAQAASALDNLWRRRLLSGRSARATLDDLARSGRNGVRVFRELLDKRGDDYIPPDSNLEGRFMDVLERAGERLLRRQVDSGDDERWVGRVDFRDEVLPLVVEVQSETFHSALVDKEHDAQRVVALRAAGFEVVEVTDKQVWHEPDVVVAKVRAARRNVLASPL
jgi:Protein of unknown function (DUF559)